MEKKGEKKDKEEEEEEEEEDMSQKKHFELSKGKRRRRRRREGQKRNIAGSSFPRNSTGANANGEDGRTKKEHAPHSGACSTWVDDEIEAMPEELRNACRGPSCCEKDEAEQRRRQG